MAAPPHRSSFSYYGGGLCFRTVRKELTEHNVAVLITFRKGEDQEVPKIPMTADQIARDLADRVAAGEYGEPGTQLPTYESLATLYDVSESTITKVIGLLKERRVVVGVQGRGTFVAERT